MDFCFLVLSIIMGIVYAVYFFSAGNELTCAANQKDFYPLDYNSQSELDLFLQRPGSVNVTASFNAVIKFGFISNCIICFYLVGKMCAKEETLEKCGSTRALLKFLINGMWMT